MRRLPGSDLDVFPLCLGGNVFGGRSNEQESFAVLDAYVAAGGNFVDTADIYTGGESEQVIGRWMAQRGNRDQLVLATKVGMGEGELSPAAIREHAETSLKRLGTDRIDLYYAHRDDPDTPLADALGALDALVREGKVRWLAGSNYSAARLTEALAVSEREGLARFVALQPEYNLVERDGYEGELQQACERHGVACIPFYGLANGFLTGKYRPGGPPVDSSRASRASAYLDERGIAVLAALDAAAAAHERAVSAVALAWLAAQPTVLAPIASARVPEQLAELVQMAELELSAGELSALDAASS